MQQIFVEVPVIFIYAEFLSWNPSLPRVRCHLHHAENSLFHRNLKENNRKWHTIQFKNLMCVLTKCLGKIIFHIYFIHNKSHHCTAFRIITIQNCTCFVFNIYIQHTGCPTIEYSLCFGCFLSFQSSYRGIFYYISTAQETMIPKLTLLSSLCQKLINLQSKTWSNLDLDTI